MLGQLLVKVRAAIVSGELGEDWTTSGDEDGNTTETSTTSKLPSTLLVVNME